MRPRELNDAETERVCSILRSKSRERGGAAALAFLLGVSQQTISGILAGERRPGRRVMENMKAAGLWEDAPPSPEDDLVAAGVVPF